MIDGFHNPYKVHSQYGGYTVVLAHEFVEHCTDAVTAATEGTLEDSKRIGELQVALKAVEAAFLRGMSDYNPKSARSAAQELREQDQRLQHHMYLKYIRENDTNKARYRAGDAAMSVMRTLHEKSVDLLNMAVSQSVPPHLKAVQTEMCWHILYLCESGANVIAEASRIR